MTKEYSCTNSGNGENLVHKQGGEISRSDVGMQRAKKVVSDSPGLVDFAIGLVIFVLNLPDR